MLGVGGGRAGPDGRTGTAQAHVGHLDVVGRIAVGPRTGHPVDPADHLGGRASPGGIENLGGEDLGPRHHADDAQTVVLGPDRAGDVGAVAVVVVGRAARADAVAAALGDEVRVVEIDAGVDHRDVGCALLPHVRGRRRADAPQSGRRGRLAGGEARDRLDLAVGGHRSHLWVGLEAIDLSLRQLGGEALDRAPVDVVSLEALAPLAGLGLLGGALGGAVVSDDVTVRDHDLSRPGITSARALCVGDRRLRTASSGQHDQRQRGDREQGNGQAPVEHAFSHETYGSLAAWCRAPTWTFRRARTCYFRGFRLFCARTRLFRTHYAGDRAPRVGSKANELRLDPQEDAAASP